MISPKSIGLTHRQIAEEVGVSRQLVGFALRGEGRMSDEVRQRIVDVAHSSGYDQFSNGAARSMAARRHGKQVITGLLAVLFTPTFEGRPLSSVPFFMPFFEGLENEAIERGLDLMLCPLRPQGLPRLVREGQVDGVICLMAGQAELPVLNTLKVPVIHIAAACWEKLAHNIVLTNDSHTGGLVATQHLIDLGHRNIAYLGHHHLIHSSENVLPHYKGYCDALHEAGLALEDSLTNMTTDGVTIEAGFDAMVQMLGRGKRCFTGVVCHNDLIAMGAVRALQEAGLRVPEDVSVVGFDDVSPHYAFRPSLTSVRFPRQEMGRRAVQLLSESRTQCLETPGKNNEIFPVQLVERESTGPCKS